MSLHGIPDAHHNAEMLSKYDPEELRRKVVEGGSEEFASGLIEALKPRINCALCQQKSGYHRWAYVLFAKVAKLAQADAMVLIAVLNRIGVRDESELLGLVESGRRFERMSQDAGVSLETYRDEALELLKAILTEHPEWRNDVVQRLSSGAEVIEHTNGGPQ